MTLGLWNANTWVLAAYRHMAERWSSTTRPDRRSDLHVCLISWILFVTSASETDVSVDILFSNMFFHNISQQERRQKAATQSCDLVLIRCNTENPIKLRLLRVCVWLKFCHKILPTHIKNSADTKQGGKWSSRVLRGGEVVRFTLGMLQSNKLNVITQRWAKDVWLHVQVFLKSLKLNSKLSEFC